MTAIIIVLLLQISCSPDLPRWMHYRHANGSQQAYLYGSATEDGNIDIEVVALNKYNYETAKETIKFRVTAKESEETDKY